MDLSGKAALVTGAARRIGRAIALALARAGADVAVHYNRSAAEAEGTVEEIRRLGVRALAVRADLRRLDEIEAMFAAVAEAFGRLDVLVNNASVFYPTPLGELTEAEWEESLGVNAKAPAFCIQAAGRLMRAGGGAIVNVTDIAAARPWRTFVAYCASKAALAAVTVSAAKALAPAGIRVNAVAPGVIEPPAGTSPESVSRLVRDVPLGRRGSPDDVAAAVLFLLRSDYVTGQTVTVDGGKSIA
jgi:pteridine reductase